MHTLVEQKIFQNGDDNGMPELHFSLIIQRNAAAYQRYNRAMLVYILSVASGPQMDMDLPSFPCSTLPRWRARFG